MCIAEREVVGTFRFERREINWRDFSELEGSQERVSDQGMRKTLYQRVSTGFYFSVSWFAAYLGIDFKIQPLFPDGWMTTQSISREG